MLAADVGRDSIDARLLWACANPFPDRHEIAASIDNGADVDRVAWAALNNRVGPLYWRSLGEVDARDRLGGVGQLIERDANLRRLQEEMLLPRALELALMPLVDAGLEPLVFKGPALLDRYPERGLRPMDDIDVIVPERQHRHALAALTRVGWQAIDQRPGAHYDTYLVHQEVPDLSLELHWDLAVWRERANSISAMTLWKRRRPVVLEGVPAFTLPVDIELLALASHAGKPFHHFRRLMWSVDIALVARTAGDELDWDHVAALARRFACQTVLAVALHHAVRLGADVPEGVRRLPRDGLRRRALEPVIADDWPLTSPDEGTVHRLRYALWDSRARQAELLVGEMTEAGNAGSVPRNAVRIARLAARRLWSGRRRRNRR